MLFISTSQVVHLRFASELKYVNLGSRDIVAYREHPSRLEIDTRNAQSLPSFSRRRAVGTEVCCGEQAAHQAWAPV